MYLACHSGGFSSGVEDCCFMKEDAWLSWPIACESGVEGKSSDLTDASSGGCAMEAVGVGPCPAAGFTAV
jgi:hypothetical protein